MKSFQLNLTSETRVSVREYSDFLNNTKVSLCLPGNFSPETFRFYESMKIGCIVVSATMPANGLYRSHPGVQLNQIDDVDQVAETLQSILETSEEHDAMQVRSLEAWESHYSPQAVAAAIKQAVSRRAAACT